MISHGSHVKYTEMSIISCSHQLGEGQFYLAVVPKTIHPSRLIYGSHFRYAAMSFGGRSHQLGEGQYCFATMPMARHPSRLVSRRPINRYRNVTPTPPPEGRVIRLTQQCLSHHALPYQFTRGQTPVAEMLFENRLSREGSIQHCNNARIDAPFPTSLREPIELRRNANLNYLPPILTRGHTNGAAMPLTIRLSREGSDDLRSNVTSLSPFPPVLGHIHDAAMPIDLRPILTRGQLNLAEMLI